MKHTLLPMLACLLTACATGAGDPMIDDPASPDVTSAVDGGSPIDADHRADAELDARLATDTGTRPGADRAIDVDGSTAAFDATLGPDGHVSADRDAASDARPEQDAEPDAGPDVDAGSDAQFQPDAESPVDAMVQPPADDRPPIRPHARNPIWLDDGTGQAIALVGVNHGWELQDDAWDREYTLDWNAWLDYLADQDLNYSRLWRVESAQQAPDDPHLATPMAYTRTGPGLAGDGGPRYDLDRIDPAWTARLRSRAASAGERGIYVSVMLFERHSSYSTRGAAFPWGGHPFAGGNNVNGIDADANGDGQGREYFLLPDEGGSAAVLALQETYLRHVIESLNDLDNVMYEICNECQPESAGWQLHMLDVARAHMAEQPQQQMVGFTGPGRTDDGGWPDFQIQLDSAADFVSPRDAGAYRNDPPANITDRVIFADSDHIDPYGRDALWVWKSFLRGLHPQALEGYDIVPPDPPRRSAERDVAVRGALGWITRVGALVDLSRMRPRNGRCSSRYCLVHPGQSYLVLAPEGGALTVDLAEAEGPMAITWLEVSTNAITEAPAVAGGAAVEIAAPFAGAAVAFLRPGGVLEPPEPEPAFCPDVDGQIVWRRVDPFTSTPDSPTFEVSIPTPDGAVFGRIEVDFDMRHGGWYGPDPTGTHPVFQIQREQWRSNLFGFMTAFGPARNEVKVISNVDLAAGEVLRLNRRPVRLEPEADYHVRYVYDAAGGRRTLVVSEGGDEITRMQDDQVVDRVETRRTLDLILGGDLNPEGPEVPTHDWRFSRVCVRVIP